MARMQLYLPDELYEAVKSAGLPASEIFQAAVRAELRRLDLLAATDKYLVKLGKEVGPPSRADKARAESLADRVARRASTRKLG